ncbi:hypothetical protein EK21DRAFT_110385 [Setomelanomma holmii]|uniref:Fungal N-terminal domain-containing protein n=1 Tax=Setomelanomma holmii TaxID=210430 RepID=A0A9P4LP75_9PLEO|nr:hypothetical protein EK21DRAFT_110385 [Setomelanomma holmii]
MPFDPISTIGILGTTAGLLSFLASAVESIKAKVNYYEECVKKLQDYNNTMEDVLIELKEWSYLWSQHHAGRHEPFKDLDYALFWGLEGYEGIKARERAIRSDVQVIAELLECRTIGSTWADWRFLEMNCPSQQEITRWTSLLRDSQRERRSLAKADERWTYKFLFAIYRNSNLKAKIEDLQKRVSQLKRTSISLYRIKHRTQVEKPKSALLQELSSIQREREELLQFLNSLFDGNHNSSMNWGLVLGSPSLHTALSRLKGKSRIQLKFTFLEQVPSGVRDINIAWPNYRNFEQTRIGEEANKRGCDKPCEPAYFLSTNRLLDQSCRPSQLPSRTPLNLSEMTAHIQAALSATRSSILLHKSSWVDGLCFCGISVYDIANSKEQAAAFVGTNCSHIDSQYRKEVFLLLAVLLAEVAIGAPIKLCFPHPDSGATEPEFEVPAAYLLDGYEPHMSWTKLSELLGERMEGFADPYTSVEYLEAMEYCFYLSQMLARREFLPEDLELCILKVETPLQKAYKLLCDRKQELEERPWYKRAHSAHYGASELDGGEVAAELE